MTDVIYVGSSAGASIQTAEIDNLAVTTAKIANDAVTYAKMQNISNTDRLLGRDTAAAGDTEEISLSTGLEFTGTGGVRVAAAYRPIEFVQTITVAGAAAAAFDFTSLSGDYIYYLDLDILNAIAAGKDLHCYINNDTTATNYYCEVQAAALAVVSAANVNEPRIGGLNSSDYNYTKVKILRNNGGYPVAIAESARGSSTGLQLFGACVLKTGTVAGITQITVKAHDASSAFAIGSTANLYRQARE